jgi:hypothetical protein
MIATLTNLSADDFIILRIVQVVLLVGVVGKIVERVLIEIRIDEYGNKEDIIRW